ncbi:MAG: hypothetical protein OWQ34_01665 [Thermoplasma acidophilum]|nr:hypothetical protein [Thermoplasma acidophilum]
MLETNDTRFSAYPLRDLPRELPEIVDVRLIVHVNYIVGVQIFSAVNLLLDG